MKIIVTGASGMVGSEVVRQAILDNDITEITAIVRSPLTIEHSKLKIILHQDFLNYSGLSEIFKNNEACLWCLGISQNAVSKEEYIKITYDYALAAAKEMLAENPSITFLFLSGEGADVNEKSRFLFGRIKGRTENALLKLPFKKLYIARPGGIIPVNRHHFSLTLSLQYKLVRFLAYFFPSKVITSVELAKVLLLIVKKRAAQVTFLNKDLKDLLPLVKVKMNRDV